MPVAFQQVPASSARRYFSYRLRLADNLWIGANDTDWNFGCDFQAKFKICGSPETSLALLTLRADNSGI
jgi:hypothetical protein